MPSRENVTGDGWSLALRTGPPGRGMAMCGRARREPTKRGSAGISYLDPDTFHDLFLFHGTLHFLRGHSEWLYAWNACLADGNDVPTLVGDENGRDTTCRL